MPQWPLKPSLQLRTVTKDAVTARTPARVRPSTTKPSMTTCDAPSRLMPSGVVGLSAVICTAAPSALKVIGAADVPEVVR